MKASESRYRARRTRWMCLFACVVGAVVVGELGCNKRPEQAAQVVPVRVRVLAPEEITVSSRFSGSVEPLQSTALAFKLPGTVQRLYRPPGLDRDVQVGDVLAKGTVIAELDEGDLRRAKASAEARVAQLEARVATAEDNLEIATRVLERFNQTSGSVSEVARDDAAAKRVTAAGELEAAAHALADAKVQLDQANDDYLNRQLVVPFDHATVAEKQIEPGERKAAHEIAFRLIDISTVHITFGVPDTMIGDPAIRTSDDRVFLGQKLRVTADAFEGRAFEAEVTKIAPQADPLTRTFLTELTLRNPQYADGQPLLRAGMIVTVDVGSENDRAVMLLPMAAVHRGRTADELIVYEAVSESGRDVARARTVLLGGVYNNQVEVLPASEVGPGSKVVITTAERLTDGLPVQVIPESPASAAMLPEAK
ncbi:MAG: efflux RND transporter periplasmic adaptor subunit [Phycisphaerales bacterium]|nr:efflux RND transporter periplasmic adaptor subunit [Phycisphaerales bacterium]